MSLINQVLHNVEKRQGVGMSHVWGAQVKPVIGHPPVGGLRFKRALGILLVLLAAGGVWWWPQLPGAPLAPPAATAGRPLAQTAAPAANSAAMRPVAGWPGPQLTRVLSSAWQVEPAGKVARADAQSTFATAGVSDIPVAKAEGEVHSPPTQPVAIHLLPEAVGRAKSAPVSGVVSKQVKPEQEVNVMIQRALDHEQKGRGSEALATLRQAVERYPQSEDARQLLASTLLDHGEEAEALALLQGGIRQYPEQGMLRKSLAKWQLSHTQPAAALENLRPLAQSSAQDAEWQWMMAMACQQTGQHAEALPYFEQAIVLHPGQAQSYVAYAVSLQMLGQRAQALQQLRTAQDLPMSERMSAFVTQRIQQLSATAGH